MPADPFEEYSADENRTLLVQDPGGARLRLHRCVLAVTSGSDEGTRVSIDKPIIRIGASARCDLVLDDPTVSRVHCEIRQIGDRYLLVDRDSTNGTFARDLQVLQVWLEPGLEFNAGETTIRFQPVSEEVRIDPVDSGSFGDILGNSRPMREIYGLLAKLAPSELSLVVEGETGTGKELVARAIHDHSLRSEGPFVVFDCSAFPHNLLESELFGHERGAFSGAIRTHRGVFERADGGTLFLDELGEMDLPLQPKLLRALERGEFRRVGGERPIQVDVRVVAATNRDLWAMVEEGSFRQDLYFRLAKVRLELPPLRDRIDDIAMLTEHFLKEMRKGSRDAAITARDISEEALEVLKTHDWPGNVRELRNVLERAATFADNTEIRPEDLPSDMTGKGGYRPTNQVMSDTARLRMPFKDAKEMLLSSFEREYVVELLHKHGMNISAAAREAGLDRRHIYRLIQKYDIGLPDRGREGR